MKLIIKGELLITTEQGFKITPRLIELLKLVHESKSLNHAVKKLGLSYSHTWNTLYKLNCHFNSPLIKTQRGGAGGGETILTETGLQLVDKYDQAKNNFKNFLKQIIIDLTDN